MGPLGALPASARLPPPSAVGTGAGHFFSGDAPNAGFVRLSPPTTPPAAPSPPPSVTTRRSSADLIQLLAVEASSAPELTHATRAEQLNEIASLLGDLEDSNTPSAKPGARLAACVLLLRGVVNDGPETPEMRQAGALDESEHTGAVSSSHPLPSAQCVWEETRGSAVVENAILRCVAPEPSAASSAAAVSAAATSTSSPPRCCARGRWQQGPVNGIASYTFRIAKSKLGDGGRLKIGLVAQGADGGMQEALVFNPRSGHFTEMPYDLPELTNGIPGEPLMGGGNSLSAGKASGAIVEVQANTMRNELRFQVTDGHGQRYPWHTAIIRRKAVPLPAVFAPFCRLGKAGDGVELVRAHVCLPAERLREQLRLPSLGVSIPELEAALSLREGSSEASDEHELSAARAKLLEARSAQAMATDGSGCTFVFLDADAIRASDASSLPALLPYQELASRFPNWLHVEALTLEDACTRVHAHDHVAVSHRWDAPEMPDPEGVQLAALRDYLREKPMIRRVWLDYCCMPQNGAHNGAYHGAHHGAQSGATSARARSEAEEQTFKLMLRNVNLLFLGVSVLILADRSYLSRFWTQFEAWLAMQDAGPSGLVSARRGSLRSRCTIVCVHGAPEGLQSTLVEEWSDCTAEKAYEKLSSADVQVTNLSDKEEQLPKILALDDRVSEVAQRMGLCPPVSPELKRVRREVPMLVERSSTTGCLLGGA